MFLLGISASTPVFAPLDPAPSQLPLTCSVADLASDLALALDLDTAVVGFGVFVMDPDDWARVEEASPFAVACLLLLPLIFFFPSMELSVAFLLGGIVPKRINNQLLRLIQISVVWRGGASDITSCADRSDPRYEELRSASRLCTSGTKWFNVTNGNHVLLAHELEKSLLK